MWQYKLVCNISVNFGYTMLRDLPLALHLNGNSKLVHNIKNDTALLCLVSARDLSLTLVMKSMPQEMKMGCPVWSQIHEKKSQELVASNKRRQGVSRSINSIFLCQRVIEHFYTYHTNEETYLTFYFRMLMKLTLI